MSAPAVSSALGKDVLLVIFLAERNEEWISRVQATHPGLEVRWVNVFNADHTFKKPEDMGDALFEGVTLICPFVYPPPPKFLSSVRFVQLTSAGIDWWVSHETYQDKNVLFCTTNGAHA